MSKQTLIQWFKSFIASIGFKMFLWGNGITKEEYWQDIYEQERQFRITDVDQYY